MILVDRMPRLSAALAIALAPLCVAVPVEARGQDPALIQVAERLAPPAQSGSTRLAVVSIADGLVGIPTRVNPDITQQVRAAFLKQVKRRDLAIVAQADVDHAVRELGVAEPLGLGGALLVGQFVDADFVVVGLVTRLPNGTPDRLTVDLIDVDRRRKIKTATAVLTAAPTPPPPQQVAVPRPPPAPAPAPPRPAPVPPAPAPPAVAPPTSTAAASSTSSSRWWIGGAGIGATAFAGLMALSKDSELSDARDDLLQIPAGATTTWNQKYADAQDIQRSRDRWLAVAVGAGATTAVFLIFTRGGGNRALVVPLLKPKVTVEPVGRGVGLVHRF